MLATRTDFITRSQISEYGLTLLSAADAAAVRSSLGLGTGDSPTFAGLTLGSISGGTYNGNIRYIAHDRKPKIGFYSGSTLRSWITSDVSDNYDTEVWGNGLHLISTDAISQFRVVPYSHTYSREHIQLGGDDVRLYRGGPGILDIRDGLNAQQLHIYNTYTSGSHNEYGGLKWLGDLELFTNKAGAGNHRNLVLATYGATGVFLRTNGSNRWVCDASGNFYPFGSLEIGSASNRVATGYFGTVNASTSVGINSTPLVKLDIRQTVSGTSAPVGINGSAPSDTHTLAFISGLNAVVNSKAGIQFGGLENYSFGGIFGEYTSSDGNTLGDITFDLRATSGASALTERARITSGGYFGIANNNPQHPFHVGSSSYVNTVARIQSQINTPATLSLFRSGQFEYTISVTSIGLTFSADPLSYNDIGLQAAAKAYLTGDGNVGFGVNPSYGLHLTKITGGVGVGFNISSWADGDAPYYFNSASTGNTGTLHAFTAAANTSGLVISQLKNNGSGAASNRLWAAGAGDAYTYWLAGSEWSAGVDNSDSDKFKIGPNQDPSTGTPAISIETNLNTQFHGTAHNFGGTSSANPYVAVQSQSGTVPSLILSKTAQYVAYLTASSEGYVVAFNPAGITDAQINAAQKFRVEVDGRTTVYGNLCFGGLTNLFPMLKRNGAALDVRLANDSGYASLNAGATTLTGGASIVSLLRLTHTDGSAATWDFVSGISGYQHGGFSIVRNGSTTPFVIDNAGKVGIGANPSSVFSVHGSGSANTTGITISNAGTSDVWRIWQGVPGSFDGFLKIGLNPTTADDWDVYLFANGIGATYVAASEFLSPITGRGDAPILKWTNTGGNFNGICDFGQDYYGGPSSTISLRGWIGDTSSSRFDIVRHTDGYSLLTFRNNEFSLHNGLNPQAFYIYNTTDASFTNFEGGYVRWSGSNFSIGTMQGGTGSNRNLRLGTDGGGLVRFFQNGTNRWDITSTGLMPSAATYDIGTSSIPVQTGYFTSIRVATHTILGSGELVVTSGTSLRIAGDLSTTSTTFTIDAAKRPDTTSPGLILRTGEQGVSNAQDRLRFYDRTTGNKAFVEFVDAILAIGGIDSSAPSLRNSSTTLQLKLADNSAFTDLETKNTKIQQGTSASFAKSGGMLAGLPNITPVGNVGAGEDDLMTFTIPANTFAVNGDTVVLEGQYLTDLNPGQNVDLKPKLGSTTLLSLTSLDFGRFSASVTIRVSITRLTSTTALVNTKFESSYAESTTSLFAGNVSPTDPVLTGLDFTAALTFKTTGESSNSDNNSVVQKSLLGWYYPAN